MWWITKKERIEFLEKKQEGNDEFHKWITTAHNDFIKELNRRIDLYFDEIKQLNQRLNLLEASNTKVVLYNSYAEEIEYSTTGAIIDLLAKETGKKLHYSIIYDKIKSYNLINKKVSLSSVKATLYGLARQNKISLCDGNETGMFFIEQKKGN